MWLPSRSFIVICRLLPSPNIYDTGHFIQKLESLNNSYTGNLNDVILATWDITAMFPSIDNTMGVQACRDALDSREVKFPSTECITDALTLILNNNISYFNGRVYSQCSGTAMGPHHACSYGDISMDPIDHTINSNEKYNNFIEFWARLRDDICAPWTGTVEDLLEFTEWINTLHPNITFKLESYSKISVNYLDCTIYKKDNKLCTTLYTKPSDTYAYLIPSSGHPTHIFKNIPYGVAVRCKRICTEDSEFNKHAANLTKVLIERGYNGKFVESEFNRVRLMDRKCLLDKSDSELDQERETGSRCFPLVADFNPKLPNVGQVLNRYKYILELEPGLKNVIKGENIFASFRKCKTIGDLLVNSRYPKLKKEHDIQGSINCGKCLMCKLYLVATNEITSPHTNNTFRISQNIKCSDEYVIYFILDKTCNKGYVGRTENPMTRRWACHKSHIKYNHDGCKIAVHFNQFRNLHKFDTNNIDSTLPDEINVTLIDKIIPEVWDSPDTLFHKLCNKESYWQNQLCTLYNNGGLNVRDERSIRQVRHSKK